MTGNETLSKIYFEKLFFQNGLAFFDLFYSYHYIRYFIYSDCMCVQYIQKQPPEVLFKKGVLENFAYLTGKHLCWCFPVKLATFLRTPNFEEHLRTTADQMIYNKILLEKIRAMFHISIKFDLNVRKTGWKKMRFQLARLTASSHRPSSTEDSSTTKEQKLTKQYFLPHRFYTQSSQYQ